MDGWIGDDEERDGQMSGWWIDGWMDRWMDGWVDRWRIGLSQGGKALKLFKIN